MNKFRLNLIRDQVPSLARRQRRFRAMALYVALAGLVLVVAVGLSSSRVARALALRSQSLGMEASFAATHEGQEGLAQGVARLQTRLANQLEALRTIDRRLTGDPRPARFLRALVLSLPANMTLHKVALNAEEKIIQFEVKLYGGGADASSGTAELMGRWQQDPAISAEISQLTQLGSQIENAGAGGNLVLQFSGRLERGGR